MQKLLRIEDYPGGSVGLAGAATAGQQAACLWRQAAATMRVWEARHATRRALAELDSHRLADIGKTAAQARHEAAKPFWRA
jgi:uncharacterized protein YjiS (DUF1127 family)